jgi:UDP-N-acetylmuramyl tripeptide synthase
VAVRLCPDVLARLADGRTSVVVTGTNGKTTTSHLVAATLAGRGPVAHNATGSNMLDGAVAALAAAPRSQLCVLEVDELHLGPVVDAVCPDVLVVLNLSRDQLDRVSEIRSTARAVAGVLVGHPETLVVANVDDPMVVWAVGAAARVVWASAGATWQADTLACPTCGHRLTRDRHSALSGSWCCSHCGLTRPLPEWWWESDRCYQQQRCGDGDSSRNQSGQEQGGQERGGDPAGGSADAHFLVHRRGGVPVPVSLGLPGRVNAGNALVALAAAAAIGTDPATAARHLAAVREVGGRYGRLAYRGRLVRSLLVKNPAGWGEALDMLAVDRPVLVVINAREADGRDVSWLWDLPVEALRGRAVAVAGERAADFGVRLSYAEIPHHTHPDPLAALETLPTGDVDAVANYTAFRDLQQSLTGSPHPTASAVRARRHR